MRVLVTAGPTREYIDPVRFLTTASSGRMGCEVARAAVGAGHQAVLLLGPTPLEPPPGCACVRFVTTGDLARELGRRFDACDALVMAAAVGDFRPAAPADAKRPRAAGPVTLRLLPTDDLLAGLARRKRPGQIVVAFALESGPRARVERTARGKMAAKGADYVVANAPDALGAEQSLACVLSRDGSPVPWGRRSKRDLAEHIVGLLSKP
jgi:phosphopantothenoylcysteine decarboxylase/phosphopantothenate--cysteine ligase